MIQTIFLIFFILFSSTSDAKIENSDETFSANFDTFKPFDLKFEQIAATELCNRQIKHFQEALSRNDLWARKMRDSWGKVPSGIFSGNLFDFGNFDQCLDFQHYSYKTGEILGQHCTLMVPFDRENSVLGRITTPSRS